MVTLAIHGWHVNLRRSRSEPRGPLLLRLVSDPVTATRRHDGIVVLPLTRIDRESHSLCEVDDEDDLAHQNPGQKQLAQPDIQIHQSPPSEQPRALPRFAI